MENEEEITYKVLDYKQFFEKYNKNHKDSRFINKAYSETGNSVAVFAQELKYDCYFQLPDYGKDVVPDNRRYIYFIPANGHENIPHKLGKFSNGKDKVSISIEHLKMFADPYTNFKEQVVNKTKEEVLLNKIKTLIEEYERNK
jgi:hypothetical protein